MLAAGLGVILPACSSGTFIRHIHLAHSSGPFIRHVLPSPICLSVCDIRSWPQVLVCCVYTFSPQSSVAFCCIIDSDSAKTVLKTMIERLNKWCEKIMPVNNFNYIVTTLILIHICHTHSCYFVHPFPTSGLHHLHHHSDKEMMLGMDTVATLYTAASFLQAPLT